MARGVATTLGFTALGTLVAVTVGAVTAGSPVATSVATGALPPPRAPAFMPGPPRALGSTRHIAHWAPVRRATLARSGAGGGRTGRGERGDADAGTDAQRRRGARSTPGPRRADLGARAPAGAPQRHHWLDPATRARRVRDGRRPARRRSPRLRMSLYRDGRVVLRAAVAVGAQARRPRAASSISATGSAATGAPPTDRSPLAPAHARRPRPTGRLGASSGSTGRTGRSSCRGGVSHGCIRLRNADMLALAKRLPVGTPLTIH